MPKRSEDTKNKPWVSNYKPLQEWLDKHGAQCMWQIPMQQKPEDADYDWAPNAYVECWRVGKSSVVLVVRADRMGWDIYSPLNTNSVPESLADAEKRCGITSE